MVGPCLVYVLLAVPNPEWLSAESKHCLYKSEVNETGLNRSLVSPGERRVGE